MLQRRSELYIKQLIRSSQGTLGVESTRIVRCRPQTLNECSSFLPIVLSPEDCALSAGAVRSCGAGRAVPSNASGGRHGASACFATAADPRSPTARSDTYHRHAY